MQACTIIARNYLAHARVLADSFAAHHPDGRFSVLVVDGLEGFTDPAQESFEVLTPADIGLGPDIALMATRYDVLELSTAVKPWLLQELLKREDHVLYLDPDIEVFASLEPIAALAREHGVVMTPHITDAMPRDGERPHEQDILLAGLYNLGFLALGAGPTADGLISWWQERLEHDCVVDPSRGFFVDQRWMDFVPGLVPTTFLLRDPGDNLAYWNLHGRTLAADGARGYTVNGAPLRFMHFSGYDPRHPARLSKHQTRIGLDDPFLRELADAYGQSLLAAGYETVIKWPYGYAETASGVRLDRALRRAHAGAVTRQELQEDPFAKAGDEQFLTWLASPAAAGGEEGVTQYIHAVWEERDDLQRAYPTPENGDAAGLIGWFQVYAPQQMQVPPGAVPPGSPDNEAHVSRLGVNLVGYLHSEHGVGEVARQAARALEAAHIDVVAISQEASASRQGHEFEDHSLTEAEHPVNLLCINADQTVAFADRAGAEFFAGRHTIGWWWWEVQSFPGAWMGAFERVDEVWAGSRFVADTLALISPVPVTYIPMPVELPPGVKADRRRLGLPEGFVFLFTFDYNSVFARKNPLDAVRAFVAAFPEPTVGGPTLVLKSINGDRFPVERGLLADAVAGRSDIVLREEYLDAGDKNILMASCDCYVSLHRAEGFGITIAEAMLLGKPVIATDYSGAADLLDADHSYPVGYELVAIGEGAGPYPAEGVWAQPDVAAAARAMIEVFADPPAAAVRGARAVKFIERAHSAEAVGQAMRERFEAVAAGQASGDRPVVGLDAVWALLRRGPGRSSRGGPRRVLRGAALRLTRPQASYEAEITAELAGGTEYLIESALDHVDTVRKAAKLSDAAARQRDGTLGDRLARAELKIAELSDQLSVVRPDIQHLKSHLNAVPYVAGTPFELREEAGLGRVLSYQDSSGAAGTGAYVAFEDVFRGDREVIRERQRPYLDLIGGHGPVLDAGCGRGEFLDLLLEQGTEAIGVDADAGQVALCRSLGHENVVHADVLMWLADAPAHSLGAIFSAQVVEHMPYAELVRFLELAHRALTPDGVLIVETVNPHSIRALKTFWVDLTHQHPIFPEVLLALCGAAGFTGMYAFHPLGTGDFDADRLEQGEYAVVARPGPGA